MSKKKTKNKSSKADDKAKAAQILKDVLDEFPDKSTEFCLVMAQDRIAIAGITSVDVYDVLSLVFTD